MSDVELKVDSTCPACGSDARLPQDGESEDVFFCAFCMTKLVIKVAPFDTPMRAWVVTYESEREAVAKLYDGSKARATFNGREVTGGESLTLATPETMLPEVGQVLTLIHEDGRHEKQVVSATRFERGPGELGTFVYETEPVEES